jgi:amino acid adenylation domain-containing protein
MTLQTSIESVRSRAYAASHAQRRLWTIAQMDPGSSEYSLPGGLLLEGQLDLRALRKALDALVERHESLRTTFDMLRGEVCQLVHSRAQAALEEIDLRHEFDQTTATRNIADSEARRPFDLRRGPLFRAALLTLADDRFVLLYNLHHIIADEYSIGLIVRDLSLLYAAFCSGRPNPLPMLELQYKDFAGWQNERLAGPEARDDKHYWMQKFAGTLPVLELTTDFPRPRVRTSAGASVLKTWEPALLRKLEDFARKRNVTLFLVLAALVRVHLFRSSGQSDIVVGVPASSRDESELEQQIGLYVDMFALRQSVRPEDSFNTVLEKEQNTLAEAFDHPLCPFDQLVNDLRIPRDPGRTPLFQVSIQLQDTGATGGELDGLRISEFPSDITHAKFDLSYTFRANETGLHCFLIYSADLFRPDRAEAMLTQLRCLAEAAIQKPIERVDRLNILGEHERHTVIYAFNMTEKLRATATIVSLLESCVASHPEAPAIIEGERTVSFGDLNAQANRLAHFLLQCGLGLEAPVAVLLDRSVDWVIAVLGILKAGAVYVPIDPTQPRARVLQIVQDSGAATIVTTSALSHALPSSPARTVCLDHESLSPLISNPPLRSSEANIAYMIYTSGSTGMPKGVAVEHRGLANTVLNQIERFGIGSNDRVLQWASVSFDLSIWELFVPLLAGGCVALMPRAVSLDSEQIRRFLAEHVVTVALLTPSFVRSIGSKALSSLRLLATGGEAASTDICRDFARTGPCFNLYGPTEASVVATSHAVSLEEEYPFGIPIGRPLTNTQAYVLDRAMNPLPIGVRGELYLGGEGLARGYHDRRAATAAAFVPDPFSKKAGARLYKTGDVVRWTAEGELEYFGRTDHQVKVRGRRIELGEVEAALNRLAGVREAVAVVRTGADGDNRLAAYLVPENGPIAVAALRKELAEMLADGLVPDIFVQVPAFKLNAAGKIDRAALPAPANDAPEIATDAAPRTDLERVIAGVFARLIGVPQLGIRDSFFDLGGNSLLATQAVARIRDLLRVDVSITAFFEAESVERLAARLMAETQMPERLEKIAGAVVRFERLSEDEKAAMIAEARRRSALNRDVSRLAGLHTREEESCSPLILRKTTP